MIHLAASRGISVVAQTSKPSATINQLVNQKIQLLFRAKFSMRTNGTFGQYEAALNAKSLTRAFKPFNLFNPR